MTRRNSCSTSRASRRRSSIASWSLRNASTNCARNSSKRSGSHFRQPCSLILHKFHCSFPFITYLHCRNWMRTSPHQRRRSRSGCPSRRRTSSTFRRRRKPISSADSVNIWSSSAAGSSAAFLLHVTMWSKISWERLGDAMYGNVQMWLTAVQFF